MTNTTISRIKYFREGLFDPTVWILFITLQFLAIRPLFKYLPERFHWAIFPYFIACFVWYLLLRYVSRHPVNVVITFFDRWALFITFFAALITINFIVYPIADSLKEVMRGSDQDDSLIIAGMRLLSLQPPYSTTTYLGSPMSPGPGWVILLLPFTITGGYFLITPVFLSATAYTIKILTGRLSWGNISVLMVISSLGFWELMVVGSDLWALGCTLQLCLVLIYFGRGRRLVFDVGLALMVALVVQSRIIFAYIIPVFATFLWKEDSKSAIRFFLLSSLFLFSFHGLFFAWDPTHYTPLHLLAKGNRLLTPYFKALTVVCSAVAWVLSLLLVKNTLRSWLFFFWICLIVPLSLVSVSALMERSFNFALWEESNYIVPAIPTLVAYVCLMWAKTGDRIARSPRENPQTLTAGSWC